MAAKPDAASSRKKESSPGQMREHIIDASLRCIERWGIAKTGMGDIANEAGVVRATVYNHFPQKQDVMQAAFLRVVQGFFAKMMQQVDKRQGFAERLVEAALYICENLPKDPYLSQILDPSMASLANDAAIAAPESEMIRHALMEQVIGNNAAQYQHRIAELSEISSRVILSLLLVKAGKKRTRKELRLLLEHWLVPMLKD